MAQDTKIQWAHHTWNPWRGCTKVSEGCDHCYAEAMSVRNPGVLGVWGDDGTRPTGGGSYMTQPYRWDRAAERADERHRVFCGSLMDFWEDRVDLAMPRSLALAVAARTHCLDWLFLTKRPQNILRLLETAPNGDYPTTWRQWYERQPPRNWWMGCTVENQARAAERIPILLDTPAALRWLSVEPLLESVDLTRWLATRGIHWVIVGGESNQGGAQARPFDISWAEEVVTQCKAAKTSVFVKQMGSRPIAEGLGLKLRDRHGGDMEEWPEWLRTREVPRLNATI